LCGSRGWKLGNNNWVIQWPLEHGVITNPKLEIDKENIVGKLYRFTLLFYRTSYEWVGVIQSERLVRVTYKIYFHIIVLRTITIAKIGEISTLSREILSVENEIDS
jgi:hypothetical protein